MEKKEKKDNNELIIDFNNQNDSNPNILKSKIVYQIDDKYYNLQMFILQELKKLKINLEVTDKNNSKSIYSNTFTISELISKNKFFSQFKDYSEAFNYLLNNSTQVGKTEFINGKKRIKILLLFLINENSNENNVNQESIEFVLNYKNINSNKAKSNEVINTTINNLKSTLEKFNISINELKINIDNIKNEKKNMKNEIENMVNIRLKDNNIIKELNLKINNIENKNNNNINKEQNSLRKNLEEIQTKMDKYDNDINGFKIMIEENNKKYNELTKIRNGDSGTTKKGSETFINEEKYRELLDKINKIEESIKKNKEKNKEFETNINNKISEINNKLNNNSKNLTSINSDRGGKHQPININLNGDDTMVENMIQEKINNEMKNRMKIYDEKIQILNKKIIDLEIKNQNKMVKDAIIRNEESSFIKDSSYIDFKFHELEEKMNKNFNNKYSSIDNINFEKKENKNNKDTSTNEKAKTTYNNDIDNKINNSLENRTKELINIKIEDLKKEMYNMIYKLNEQINNKNSYFDKMKDYTDSDYKSYNDMNKSSDIKSKDTEEKLKQTTYKVDKKNKYYDTGSSLNMNLNKTYVVSSASRGNNFNSFDEDENASFNTNTYKSNKRNKKYIELNIESNILKKDEITEDFFLFSKIKEMYPHNRYMRLMLIYRGSKDGQYAKDFHSKCDLIGPNITLIKTKKNYIFGGFTNKGWKHLFKDIKKDDPDYGTEYKDDKAFCFSINLKKIYKNGRPNDNIIYCHNNYGPAFISFFTVFDDYLNNGGALGKIEESYFRGQDRNFEITGGEGNFKIDEIEVFQIIFR